MLSIFGRGFCNLLGLKKVVRIKGETIERGLSNQPHENCCHENVTICTLVCANHLNFLSLEGGTLFIWKTKFDIPMLLNILLVRSHHNQLASFFWVFSLENPWIHLCKDVFTHAHTYFDFWMCASKKNSKFVGCACLIIIIIFGCVKIYKNMFAKS
jgi:hypothetical protein